jgi:hypothetical protein
VLCFLEHLFSFAEAAELERAACEGLADLAFTFAFPEREPSRAEGLGNVLMTEGCVLSSGARHRANRTPVGQAGISPERNGHSTGNHSGKNCILRQEMKTQEVGLRVG